MLTEAMKALMEVEAKVELEVVMEFIDLDGNRSGDASLPAAARLAG